MADPSEFVRDAIKDIRLTLRKQRQMNQRTVKSNLASPVSRDISCLVSEVERLRAVLKGLSARYRELAEDTFADPFSPAYEQALAELEMVQQVLDASEKRLQLYRCAH